MRGHTRLMEPRLEPSIYRKNVLGGARPCPSVPSLNFHGKEGSSGRVRQSGLASSQSFPPEQLGVLGLQFAERVEHLFLERLRPVHLRVPWIRDALLPPAQVVDPP
jgi:hypothetical protein